MAINNDNWMRVFDIQDTSKHVKGFTLYKVVSIVYPKTCPDAVTKITVWKRYNDFKKLHRELKIRHKSFHIEDKFPALPNSSFFKRFDSEVINQRKNNILTFLEYIAFHPTLFKSTEFVKFFETSHTPQEALNSNINIIRAQLNLPNDPEIIYPYNSDDDLGHSDSDSISTFSIASTSILQVDESSLLESRSNSSLANLNHFSESASNIDLISSSVVVASPPNSTTSTKSSKNLFPTPPSTPEVIKLEQDSTNYLSVAAEFITKATELEIEMKFQESFNTYKSAIATLLDGVKGDKESGRRQMVRHKVEKYLLRAEKIYNLHLSPEITHIKNLCKNGNGVTIYSIKRPIEDLFNYKVLKFIGNGMVVLHRKEHNVFYMKVIQKCLQMPESMYLNIPKDVPYMVKLFQYYDSSDAIFIVTQYVSGGSLLDYIKQKTNGTNEDIRTSYSSVTFERETSQLHDREDGNYSDSSEYSYSDLISDYTSQKNSTSLTSISKCEKQSNSDTEGSSATSQTSDCYEPKEASQSTVKISQSVPNINLNDAPNNNTNDNVKSFQRSMSERSYTEEFSSINYVPPLQDIVKWAAQLLLAIDKLHKVGIVVCDLDLNKVLLDEKGNLLLTYICNFREKGNLCFKKFENNYYCAPEVFGLDHVTYAADWWSYGSVLFEMLTGMSLRCVHPEGISNYTILKIPKYVCAEGKSLLRQLLLFEPHERLGCGANGTDDIKSHPFFVSVDWIQLQKEAFKT